MYMCLYMYMCVNVRIYVYIPVQKRRIYNTFYNQEHITNVLLNSVVQHFSQILFLISIPQTSPLTQPDAFVCTSFSFVLAFCFPFWPKNQVIITLRVITPKRERISNSQICYVLRLFFFKTVSEVQLLFLDFLLQLYSWGEKS